MKIFISCAALLISSAVSATPVYLDCEFEQIKPARITLDEQASKAVVEQQGEIRSVAAIFTADSVRVLKEPQRPRGNSWQTIEINRSSLSARFSMFLFDSLISSDGMCKIQKVSDRAF